MNAQIVTLLDSPSEEAFGMVPLLVKVDGQWEVWGVKGKPRWRLDDASELLEHPRLIQLAQPIPVNVASGLAAGWIGQKWRAEADTLNLFPWTQSPSRQHPTRLGHFWVDTTENIYQQLSAWLNFAAVQFYREKDIQSARAQAIARLMRWTLPDDPRTMAVMIDSKTSDAQPQRIDWYLELQRIERPGLSRDEFLAEIKKIRVNARVTPKPQGPRVFDNRPSREVRP